MIVTTVTSIHCCNCDVRQHRKYNVANFLRKKKKNHVAIPLLRRCIDVVVFAGMKWSAHTFSMFTELNKGEVKACLVCCQTFMMWLFAKMHCIKSVLIRSFSGPYFPAFGLNTDIYFVNLRTQYESGKVRTRKTPSTDTFHAVRINCYYVNG